MLGLRVSCIMMLTRVLIIPALVSAEEKLLIRPARLNDVDTKVLPESNAQGADDG